MRNFSIAFAIMISFWFTPVQAALIVDSTGQLTGATTVFVNNGVFDVEFIDGTCANLFNGCDDVSDFVFPNRAAAIGAAQALFSQVFIDSPEGNFRSDPSLTRGCDSLASFCEALTPFHAPVSGGVIVLGAKNSGQQTFSDSGWSTTLDTTPLAAYVYAVWTPKTPNAVPLPGTIVLVMGGLLGLMSLRNRRIR